MTAYLGEQRSNPIPRVVETIQTYSDFGWTDCRIERNELICGRWRRHRHRPWAQSQLEGSFCATSWKGQPFSSSNSGRNRKYQTEWCPRTSCSLFLFGSESHCRPSSPKRNRNLECLSNLTHSLFSNGLARFVGWALAHQSYEELNWQQRKPFWQPCRRSSRTARCWWDIGTIGRRWSLDLILESAVPRLIKETIPIEPLHRACRFLLPDKKFLANEMTTIRRARDLSSHFFLLDLGFHIQAIWFPGAMAVSLLLFLRPRNKNKSIKLKICHTIYKYTVKNVRPTLSDWKWVYPLLSVDSHF